MDRSLPLRIAIFWRALSDNASHRLLLERIRSRHGHSLCVLVDARGESWNAHDGIFLRNVRVHNDWHPAVRILTGWKRALASFDPQLLLGLEEPYSFQAFRFLQWAMDKQVPYVFLSCQNINRLLPYPFRLLESFVLRNAQGAWFLNGDAASRARRRGFRGIGRVIPLGTNLPTHLHSLPGGEEAENSISPQETARVRESEFTVGYVGRLVPEKGVENLVRACSRADCHLLVAGEGPSREKLVHLAKSLLVGGTWLGKVDSLRLPEVYSRMDVLVLPSITTKTWKEQFGRVLIEAMAHGVPVVGSNSGEIPQVIGEAGLIYPERDIDYLSTLLSHLKTSSQLRSTLAIRGKERAKEKFSWDQISDQLNDLIMAAARMPV